MADTTDRPTLADVLALAQTKSHDLIRVAAPGVVLSYDPVRQAATVQPSISVWHRDPTTGAKVYELPPPIANCPVAHLGTGNFSVAWPLSPGDAVLLLVADRSTDEWRLTGEAKCDPWDARRFDWMDSYVLPMGRTFNAVAGQRGPIPAAGLSATGMVVRAPEIQLGSSAAVDYVALATLTAARLATLEAAFNAHTHILAIAAAPGTGGTGTAAATAAPVAITTAADVAATKVKAE